MDRRLILASSLAVIASVFLIAGPLSYEQERISGVRACMCPTFYHPLPWPPPPPPPPSNASANLSLAPLRLVVASLVAGLVLNFALLMRQDPDLTRKAAAGILVLSVVSMVAGDEFWVGGILGVLGSLAGLMPPRGGVSRGT